MKILVKYQKEEKEVELESGKVEDALRAADIVPESVVTKKDDKVVPDTTELKDGDKIEAIRIVSGG